MATWSQQSLKGDLWGQRRGSNCFLWLDVQSSWGYRAGSEIRKKINTERSRDLHLHLTLSAPLHPSVRWCVIFGLKVVWRPLVCLLFFTLLCPVFVGCQSLENLSNFTPTGSVQEKKNQPCWHCCGRRRRRRGVSNGHAVEWRFKRDNVCRRAGLVAFIPERS